MKDLQKFWTPRAVSNDKVTLCRLGSLRLWLAKASKEWGFAVERGDSLTIADMNDVPLDVVPENLEWQRIAFKESPSEFKLKPIFPDRSLVVKPSYPVMIPEGESARFFALIPVFLELYSVAGTKEVRLGQMPTRILSDTWFGDYESGSLCYALAFPAERDVESLDLHPHHIIVPIDLANESSDDLIFEKLCLRPEFLSIYSTPNQLWSSSVKIIHESKSSISSVKYEKTISHVENAELVSGPSEVPDRGGFQRLTFGGSAFSNDFKFNTV